MSNREIKRVKPHKIDYPIYAEHTPCRLNKRHLLWGVLIIVIIALSGALLLNGKILD